MEPQEVGWESPVSGGFRRIEAVTEQRWESARCRRPSLHELSPVFLSF